MGCMPNALSGTKSLKNALAFRKKRFFHREYRFYIFRYIFLVYHAGWALRHLNYANYPLYHAGYALRHLNYANCPRLSVSRIFLDVYKKNCVLFGLFCKKHVFFHREC